MLMIALKKGQEQQIQFLFQYTDETLVLSFLQGHMGSGWCDQIENPTCAQIIIGDFIFFAGDYQSSVAPLLVQNLPPSRGNEWILMIPENEGWEVLIESCYPSQSHRFHRFATKKDTIFDQERLQSFTDQLPEEYQLVRMNKPLYYKCQEIPWLKDLCSQFPTAEDYLARGIGFCVLQGDNIVGGVSSYTIYSEGLEIEIDIAKEHRRKGLATTCAARMILECLNQGKYPSWDAANEKSIALAKKLGYEFSNEYVTYAVELQ